MIYKWNYEALTTQQKEQRDELAKKLGISPVLCQLLIQRGISSAEEARKFFHPSLRDLHDPFL